MKDSPVEMWNNLVESLSASDILSVYSALGFEAPNKRPKPNQNNWSQDWRLPLSIKKDNKPSVAINLIHGGWKDFGSDLGGDMMDAIVSARGYDFNEALQWAYRVLSRPMPTPIKVHGKGEKWKWFDSECATKTAEYQYYDAEGNHVYSVDRIQGVGKWAGRKTFPPRAPGTKKYGFPKGTEKVLYRLPDIIEAIKSDKPIFIVEGEKDAENLWAAGLVATTNMGGAGNWLPQYTDTLRGARVVILPDNDQSGFDHMRVLLDELLGVTDEVCTVILPGLGPGGDPSDYIADGGTAASIMDLVDFDSLSGFKHQCRIAGDDWLADYLYEMSTSLCDPVYQDLPQETLQHVCKTNGIVVTEVRRRLFDKHVRATQHTSQKVFVS